MLRESKRQKPNPAKPVIPTGVVGSALKKKEPAGPVYEKGIQYWDGVEASVDGVLGGFGNGPVPHIEQLSSRLLLLSLVPSLSAFANPLTPTPSPPPAHRRVVLDVGAGIGRVTRHVLLPLFDDVVLLEPVEKFVNEAYRAASSGEWRDLPNTADPAQANGDLGAERSKENARRVEENNNGRGKRVRIIKRGLQGLDPRFPGEGGEELGVVGEAKVGSGGCGKRGDEVVYDAIWAQWCLGHMNHADLIAFLRASKAALREEDGHEHYIFVKENCCDDLPDGSGQEFLDEEDSSLTRSHRKWVDCFTEAGLTVVREEVQQGMPEELFVVKTWALR